MKGDDKQCCDCDFWVFWLVTMIRIIIRSMRHDPSKHPRQRWLGIQCVTMHSILFVRLDILVDSLWTMV